MPDPPWGTSRSINWGVDNITGGFKTSTPSPRQFSPCPYVNKSVLEFCCYLPSVETSKSGLKVSEQQKI